MAYGEGANTSDMPVEEIMVFGRHLRLIGTAASANQGSIGAEDLARRPLLRAGEIVEAIPGVIITQHSGSGKANQYFLRGFNLDHGTDLALTVDGMPVNMPSHGHGQGYADLNFLIPEMVRGVEFRKGPYYADLGDFGAAGGFDVHYFTHLPSNTALVEGGQHGFGRALVGLNYALNPNTNVIAATEYEQNDGPWVIPDRERKTSSVIRLSSGTDQNGYSLTAMAYHNDFHATNQVPLRAINSGIVDRFGIIDPSDGGSTGRYSFSGSITDTTGKWTTQASAYAIAYDLKLFSNFTYFLNDPIRGDQIEQSDKRTVFGFDARESYGQSWFTLAGRTDIGLSLRHDRIDLGLYNSEARQRIGITRVDKVDETRLSPFIEAETRWNEWARTIIGIRGEFYQFDVANQIGGNSGGRQAFQANPKASLILGPFSGMEFYLNSGFGFHSNDARGIVARDAPVTPLARAKGAELGVRTEALPGLTSSLSLWLLDLKSELVFAGDSGTTEASGPTRRYGIEWANTYAPNNWLSLNVDLAWSRARYRDHDPAGSYVPEALAGTIDAGLSIHELPGLLHDWSGAVRWRAFGPRTLTQDGAIKSKATSLVYLQSDYRLSPRWTVGLSIFNLLDSRVSDIDYYYTSRLKGEPLEGVDDILTHPAEPRAARVSITARF
jgi:hypothetical protein